MRAVIWRVRSAIIAAPRLSPEVWCAPLGPSGPATSHWLNNSQIQRLDLEKSPENHRRATDSDEVGPMKRIPSANYSLSIALPGKCSTSHVKPAVNRQPGYRRGTCRAFSKRTAGKSASLSNHQRIATTSARLETQTQSKSSKQSGNEQPASCHQKLARDTRKQTKQGKPNQLPANLKAPRRPATRSTQQPNAQNQQPDQ